MQSPLGFISNEPLSSFLVSIFFKKMIPRSAACTVGGQGGWNRKIGVVAG